MDDTQKAELEAFIEGLGLEDSAEFIPWPESRFAKPNPTMSDYSLNWVVTLKRGSKVFSTDYMQGIGHIPGYKGSNRPTLQDEEIVKCACIKGKYVDASSGSLAAYRKLPSPCLLDVLYALTVDAEALDCGSFSDWCEQNGADSDSIKDKGSYEACLSTALHMRLLLGDGNLLRLRELFQDY